MLKPWPVSLTKHHVYTSFVFVLSYVIALHALQLCGKKKKKILKQAGGASEKYVSLSPKQESEL